MCERPGGGGWTDRWTDQFPLFYRTSSPPIPSGAAAQKGYKYMATKMWLGQGRLVISNPMTWCEIMGVGLLIAHFQSNNMDCCWNHVKKWLDWHTVSRCLFSAYKLHQGEHAKTYKTCQHPSNTKTCVLPYLSIRFLDASSHLYVKVCPSVGPLVRPSVRP